MQMIKEDPCHYLARRWGVLFPSVDLLLGLPKYNTAGTDSHGCLSEEGSGKSCSRPSALAESAEYEEGEAILMLCTTMDVRKKCVYRKEVPLVSIES